MKKLILFLLLLIIPFSSAQKEGHLVLLTVAETADGDLFGATADLYLEVKPGRGRIYIDSFPLTKLDTQISTRFANQIACQEIDFDCSRYDFFYTVKANSSIIGGASAGAGIALLTVAVLEDLPMPRDFAITGTMNPGGVIGPIGGVYKKIQAAQERGITRVTIPKWGSFSESNFENETGTNLTVEVIKVGSLEEALFAYNGISINGVQGEIEISERYMDRMRAVSDILCNRAKNLSGGNPDINFTKRKDNAYNESRYYTAASYCFSENLKLREKDIEKNKASENILRVRHLTKVIQKLDDQIDSTKLRTLSDLETYMVVKERLIDAASTLTTLDLYSMSSTKLSYVIERYFSAVAWSQFYGLGGKPFVLEEEHLKNACTDKLAEAEERLDYLSTISPAALETSRRAMRYAYKDQREGRYALCVFKASKVKADTDSFLLAIIVKEEDLPKLIEEKLEATKKIILKQQAKGIFPILGYSYYEYATSLKDTDPGSALIFSEYSLEMSNLDLYFPSSERKFKLPIFDVWYLYLTLTGIIIGFILGYSTSRYTKSRSNPRRPRKVSPGKRGE